MKKLILCSQLLALICSSAHASSNQEIWVLLSFGQNTQDEPIHLAGWNEDVNGKFLKILSPQLSHFRDIAKVNRKSPHIPVQYGHPLSAQSNIKMICAQYGYKKTEISTVRAGSETPYKITSKYETMEGGFYMRKFDLDQVTPDDFDRIVSSITCSH